jgi:hypothetical protein
VGVRCVLWKGMFVAIRVERPFEREGCNLVVNVIDEPIRSPAPQNLECFCIAAIEVQSSGPTSCPWGVAGISSG